MKTKAILLMFVLLISLAVGCAPQTTNQPQTTPTPTPTQQATPTPAATTPTTTPEAQTSASIVNENAAFEKAISSTGTWIICTLKDLSFTKELVLDGEFKNGKKDEAGKDIIQRKIALYTQDENRNVTNRFSLTAPKLTIKSPNASLWYGTFKGDIYVSAPNFTLYNATIEGNIYFTTEEAQKTFKIDETKGTSKITGKQELKK